MAALIFRLNDVPDNEADEVRLLLNENQIDFYETTAGNWGFSVAGIWIKNNQQKQQARKLIDDYQREHHTNESASVDSFFQVLIKQPFRVIIFLSIILFVIYFSVIPFIGIGS